MDSAPRRWKLIAGLAFIAAIYWLAMFVGTHLPIRTTPAGDPYSLDKLEHLTAFGLLSILLCFLGSALGVKSWKLSLGIVGSIALYALVDETTQSFVSSRTPEVFDWLADVIGAGLGTALYWLVDRFRSTWQAQPPAE